MTTPSRITDHADAAVARLPEGQKGKANIEALIRILAGPAQTFEDAAYDVLTMRGIDTAEGVWLDAIGRVVGESRAGRSDDIYRRYIKARVAVNRSNGVRRDLNIIARLILGADEAVLEVQNESPASVVQRVLGFDVDNDVANVLITYLRQAVAGGIRVISETDIIDEDEGGDGMFTFSDDTTEPDDLDQGFGDVFDASYGGHLASAKIEARDLVDEEEPRTDGPDDVYVPTSAAEWNFLSLPVPTLLVPCQDFSGDARRSIGDTDLTAHGSGLLYRQTVTDWDRKFLGLPAGGFGASWRTAHDSLFFDVGVPCAVLAYASVASAGAARALFCAAEQFRFVNVNASGIVTAFNNGTPGTGAADHNDLTAVRPWLWYRNADGTGELLTDLEAITMHTDANSDGATVLKGIGACDPADLFRSPSARFGLFAIWIGVEIDWKAALTTLGWTLPY